MNIIHRGQAFLQCLRELAGRRAWDWRRCPRGGETLTRKHGGYWRSPWFFAGRERVRIQRHWCYGCRRSYAERSPLLVGGSWYAREVHRCAIDHWQHVGTSLRRTAEVLRSWLGRQERWQLWCPLTAPPPPGERCSLSASTVHRWLDRAGHRAQQSVAGQLAGVPTSGQLATDGLWARLRAGTKRVVLLLGDSVSGLVWPPVVVAGEDAPRHWQSLFTRAFAAGLDRDELWGVTSDGASGLSGYLRQALSWVNHQRCVFHLWRNLAGELTARGAEAAAALTGKAAEAVRQQVRRELVTLVRGVFDAANEAAAQAALGPLAAHRLGAGLARALAEHVAAALVHRRRYNRGLVRVSPEWCWRDFRLRLSRGRNHRAEARLERAALVWAIYRNFTPAQERRERKRRYRYPGQSPLAVAGVPPGEVSYLDALAV
jgi:lysophospholipase L1-like esterase